MNNANAITRFGYYATVYGLALVFGWIGMMKFTAYEAGAIAPMVASHPLLNAVVGGFDDQTTSNLIGITEITAAILVALRPVSAKLTALGAALMALTLFVTSTLLFTVGITGGVLSDPSNAESAVLGFPYINVVPGQFLVKDLGLLGAAIWLCGTSLSASK